MVDLAERIAACEKAIAFLYPGWKPTAPKASDAVPCVICGEDEPRTGTCGSDDPRALCKQADPAPSVAATLDCFRPTVQKSGQSKLGYIGIMTDKPDPRDSDWRGEDSRQWVRLQDHASIVAEHGADIGNLRAENHLLKDAAAGMDALLEAAEARADALAGVLRDIRASMSLDAADALDFPFGSWMKIIDALLSDGRQVSGGWLPIASAPKNRTAILVFVPENLCTYAVTWRALGDGGWKVGWEVFGGDWREHIQRATHWMPLPAPPEAP